MERRIRLVWSPKAARPWCPGASLPAEEPSAPLGQRTGFLRVQGLMERIRRRRQSDRERPRASVEPPPAIPRRDTPETVPCEAPPPATASPGKPAETAGGAAAATGERARG